MGAFDRILRALAVTPILVALGIVIGPGGIVPVLLYAGAGIMLGTAAIGFCPLFPLLRIDTCPHRPTAARATVPGASHGDPGRSPGGSRQRSTLPGRPPR